MKNILLLFALLVGISNIVAQESFERLYRSQSVGHIASSLDNAGGGYVSLSAQINEDGEYEKVNVTTFNNKGNIGFSKEYTFDDTLKIRTVGDVLSLSDGTIAFSVILDTDSLDKVVTLINGSGDILWSRLTGAEFEFGKVELAPSVLVEVPESYLLHAHKVLTDAGPSPIFLTAYGMDKSLLFESNLMNSLNVDAHIEQMRFSVDSSLLILGSTSDAAHPIFLTKMDTAFNILWTRTYDVVMDQTEDVNGLHMAELLDSSIVIFGALQSSGREPRLGFVLSADFEGNAEKIESITPSNAAGEMYTSGLVMVDGISVVMAIKMLNGEDVITTLVKYNLDSVISYETLLDTTVSLEIYSGELVSVDSISATFLSSSLYPEFDNFAPYLAKVDGSGTTPCYEPTMIFRFDSIGVIQDTLTWDIIGGTMVDDSVSTLARDFSFDPPLLQLADTSYCPMVPINFTVDASTRGATSYLWDDGNTDSIRVFTEEGMFIVTVTIGIEECFSLCDTSNISVLPEPSVVIGKTSQFCENGTILLQAQAMGQITSLVWSNGSTEPVIAVDAPGDFRVMIVDACDIMKDATVSVSAAELSGSTPLSISVAGPDLCADGSLLLTASGTQDVANLQWSTGEEGTQTIRVTSPGDYTVSFNSDFCPGMGSINLTEEDFNVTPSGEISSDCTTNGTAIILTIRGVNIITRRWFDGSTGSSVAVTSAGNYDVVITGPCGDEVTTSITVTQEEIDECIIITTESCLRFPNVFIPTDREEVNTAFGPKVDCNVDNYELHIYNRWGEQIWNTTDVNTRWDGTLDGSAAPGGVYFWWAQYGEDSNPIKTEGDVTLLR